MLHVLFLDLIPRSENIDRKRRCSVFTGLHSGIGCVAGCKAKVSGTEKVYPPHRDESFSLLFMLIENDPSS